MHSRYSTFLKLRVNIISPIIKQKPKKRTARREKKIQIWLNLPPRSHYDAFNSEN